MMLAMGAAPQARRLGIIGDVHTEAEQLQRALAQLERYSPGTLLCTGDLVDGPGGGAEVDRCCELLQQSRVITISGNHDRWMLDEEMRDLPGAVERFEIGPDALAFIASLPTTMTLRTMAGPLLLCHGMGPDDMASLRPDDHGMALESNHPLQALLRRREFRFVVSGHSHRRMLRELEGIVFVNAGTLLRDHGPCCLLLDAENGELRTFELAADGSVNESVEALPASDG
jgi:predicted phosphodiesterase